MTTSVQAIFERGVLRPLEPLNLTEDEQVTVTIDRTPSVQNGTASPTAPETGLSDQEFERLLVELASGPTLPRLPDDFSRADLYADHD